MSENKEIKVVVGREYQVRIRKDVPENDYVYELLMQAQKITDSICESMKNPLIEDECYLRQSVEYNGMPVISNNVVMFSSVRGAGKTSIMRTFAEKLRTVADSGKSKYFVLNSLIEPALFSENESIVRFVLSRLYADFVDIIEGRSIKRNGLKIEGYYSEDIQINRNEIAELKQQFRKCLRNIEIINNPKTDVIEMDELDTLADIGSSVNLRENIEILLHKYIQLLTRLGNSYEYIVIQIDDADLAMGTTYKICEGIKNYLNVKNLIILMAADYKQMEYAVYQEYVRKYDKLIDANPNDIDKEYYFNHCHEMAAKYMEKAFPEGHRIILPTLPEMMLKLNEERTLIKYVELKDGKENNLLNDYLGCRSAQSQLLHYVYLKTGIVFDDTCEKSHPFMPKTFRELTHLLRLLRDMESVNTTLAYQVVPGKDEVNSSNELQSKKERMNIAKNIGKLEEYFSDYWCPSNLSDSEERIIQRILSTSEKNNLRDIEEIVNKLCFETSKNKNNQKSIDTSDYERMAEVAHSFRDCIKRLEEYCRKTNNYYKLLVAMKIYYTLHISKWIAEGWDNQKEISKIGNYIGQAFPFEDLTADGLSSEENKIYRVFNFKIEKNSSPCINIDDVLRNPDNKGLLDSVIFDSTNSRLLNNIKTDGEHEDEDIVSVINDEKTDKTVRYLNSMMILLRHPKDIFTISSDASDDNPNAPIPKADTVGVSGSSTNNTDIQKQIVLPYSAQAIREILSSYDLQESLLSIYHKSTAFSVKYREFSQAKDEKGLFFSIIQVLLQKMDKKYKDILSKRNTQRTDDPDKKDIIKPKEQHFYDLFYREANKFSYALFWLSNYDNIKFCVSEEKRLMTNYVNSISILADKSFSTNSAQYPEVPLHFMVLQEKEISLMNPSIAKCFTTINDSYKNIDILENDYNNIVSEIERFKETNGNTIVDTTFQTNIKEKIDKLKADCEARLKDIGRIDLD